MYKIALKRFLNGILAIYTNIYELGLYAQDLGQALCKSYRNILTEIYIDVDLDKLESCALFRTSLI